MLYVFCYSALDDITFRPVILGGSPCLLWAVFEVRLWSTSQMRPDTTSIRTEDVQNSLVGKCGVGRVYAGHMGVEPTALGLRQV